MNERFCGTSTISGLHDQNIFPSYISSTDLGRIQLSSTPSIKFNTHKLDFNTVSETGASHQFDRSKHLMCAGT